MRTATVATENGMPTVATVTLRLPGRIVNVEGQNQVTVEVEVANGITFSREFSEATLKLMGVIEGERWLDEQRDALFHKQLVAQIR